jgi:hypothetical protein
MQAHRVNKVEPVGEASIVDMAIVTVVESHRMVGQ